MWFFEAIQKKAQDTRPTNNCDYGVAINATVIHKRSPEVDPVAGETSIKSFMEMRIPEKSHRSEPLRTPDVANETTSNLTN
jgi:hypothetical protein